MSDKWHKRYLDLAEHVSSWSKDPSTKVGAVIVAPPNRPIGFGVNGFPRGSNDSPELFKDREFKYRHIIHAEINAILNSRQCVDGCVIYVTHPPCQQCAGTIVQAGISNVYCKRSEAEFDARWNVDSTITVLKDCGINLEFIG